MGYHVATSVWDHSVMSTSDDTLSGLRKAVRAKNRAEQAAKAARASLAEAIADALRAGVKPTAVVAETGYTREHVRRIAREHDVPSAR